MNNDIIKCCRLCEFAQDTVGDEMICYKRGPVSADNSCRKFRYDPFKRVPPKGASLKLDTEINPL